MCNTDPQISESVLQPKPKGEEIGKIVRNADGKIVLQFDENKKVTLADGVIELNGRTILNE